MDISYFKKRGIRMKKLPFIVGSVSLKSNLIIEEVGEIISDKLFGGLKFGGREMSVYEEVPAIYISSHVLGLRVILSGYSGHGEEDGYALEVSPGITANGFEWKEYNIGLYLTQLCKEVLADTAEISVLES